MRLRFELLATLVEIDLLLAERERLAATGEGDNLHTQHALVEATRGRDVRNGQDEVVEAQDLHDSLCCEALLAA